MKKIRITSKKDGFRRCGIAHPGTATEYPAEDFDETQLAALKAEPMLVVTVVEDDGVIAETPDPKTMTVPALKVLLDKLEVKHDAKATKKDLLDLLDAHTAEPPEEG